MAEDNNENKPKLDVKKILAMAFVTLNVLVVSGGSYLVYAGTLGHKTVKATESELNEKFKEYREQVEAPSILYSMEAFNTNLEGLPRRFVRIEMSVEMYDKEGFEELVTLGGQSRDAITRILNSKKFDELETVQGKLHLKNDVIAHLNETLQRGVVKNIYFTKFQVQ